MSGNDDRQANAATFRLTTALADCLWGVASPRITEEAAIAEEMEDEALDPVIVWQHAGRNARGLRSRPSPHVPPCVDAVRSNTESAQRGRIHCSNQLADGIHVH